MMTLTVALLLGSVTVVLPPDARVSGTELRLGSIARVEGDDQSEVENLKSMHLGYAPAPGYSRLFDATQLLIEMREAAPEVDIGMSGAQTCRVWPQTSAISGQAIEDTARAELERHLDLTDAKATIVARARDIRVPASAKKSELRSLVAGAAVRPGVVSVPVRVMVDGTVYRTVWTSWNIEIWAVQSLLVRDVQAGQKLTADMFERKRVALPPHASRSKVLGQELVIGSTAARNLTAGNVLTERDVIRPTLIKAGDTVFFEIKNGAITARVSAIALEEGSRGDRIRVSVLPSEREIRGVVASRDLVHIDLGPAR